MITIQELLYNRGLAPSSKTKLVRHKDPHFDLYNMYTTQKDNFLTYQSQQGKDAFKGADYIVSFIGEEGSLSRFVGVFRILDCVQLSDKQSSIDGGVFEFQYKLEEVTGFDDLKERAIIDWGKGTRSWVQWLKMEKEILEIQPGLHYKQFTDYFEFILTFEELKEIVDNQYPVWKKMLSATSGIYLIQDTSNGKQYVGSAYGTDGIWGRWTYYVNTNGHGENLALKELVALDKNHARHFQYTILMLLPKTYTQDQAVKTEMIFKQKLGSRAFGLNNN